MNFKGADTSEMPTLQRNRRRLLFLGWAAWPGLLVVWCWVQQILFWLCRCTYIQIKLYFWHLTYIWLIYNKSVLERVQHTISDSGKDAKYGEKKIWNWYNMQLICRLLTIIDKVVLQDNWSYQGVSLIITYVSFNRSANTHGPTLQFWIS